MRYKTTLTLVDETNGVETTLTGELSDDSMPQYKVDFTADFTAFAPDHVMMSQAEWNSVFALGIEQGASVYCLEQNTDATRHDFTIGDGGVMKLFMPKGSYGMGHRSCQIKLQKVNGPVNCSFEWLCEDPGNNVNLWVAGGGKWGPAIQYGPIQSGATGGIRFMPTWAAGASTLGKQDITCSIQNQPDGGQWLQPPYYGHRPIVYETWYKCHFRMIGGGGTDNDGTKLPPQSVRCEYWKDTDPVMSYRANTTNANAQQGQASVFIDWTAFFGGGAANAAPADATFCYRNLRVWVEE